MRIAITAADEGAHVVITTPRKNTGANISDSNHTPFTAMYNADETPSGMTFELHGVSSVAPGTVLIIVFKLVPAGAASSGPSPAASGSGSLKLSGPTSNKLGSSFTYSLSADAHSAAVLEVFEEPGSACAGSASGYPLSTARVHQSVPAGAFTVDFHLTAEPAGSFALCAYLVDPSTKATEARAAGHWTNHA